MTIIIKCQRNSSFMKNIISYFFNNNKTIQEIIFAFAENEGY